MKRLSSLLLLFVLMISPFTVFAQDGEDMETYTSEDGLLTVQYPADWVAQTLEDSLPFPHVALSTESAAATMNTDEPPAPGDAAIIVMLFPAEFVALMTEGDADAPVLSEESTPAELATFFKYFFSDEEGEMATEEPEMAATPEMESEAEEVELSDELTAGMVDISDETQDATLIVFEITDGVYAIVWAATYPGEFSDEFQQLAQDVAVSVTYDGTAEDIMNAMMIPVETEDTGGDTSATLDGEALVSEACTACHSRDRIDAQDNDEAGWAAIVDRMIGYGAQLNSEERDAVIQYLVDTH